MTAPQSSSVPFVAGEFVDCVNDSFPGDACEWADELPRAGEVYRVRDYFNAFDAQRSRWVWAVLLQGFGNVYFDRVRFETSKIAVQDIAVVAAKRESASRRRPYPFLIVRLASALYQPEPIEIRKGPPTAAVRFRKSFVSHPRPFNPNGTLSESCKGLFITLRRC